MPNTLRSFIGVDFKIPPKVRSLVETLGTLGKAVRAVPVENLHVTLKFLGDVDLDAIRPIDEAVKEACAETPPFEARLVGLGAFPKIERPSVVWIGMEGAEPLVEIAEWLEAAVEPFGFPPEARAFAPHLTVARVKFRPPPELGDLFEQHATTTFGGVAITRAVLYQSERGSGGPVYTPLATYDL